MSTITNQPLDSFWAGTPLDGDRYFYEHHGKFTARVVQDGTIWFNADDGSWFDLTMPDYEQYTRTYWRENCRSGDDWTYSPTPPVDTVSVWDGTPIEGDRYAHNTSRYYRVVTDDFIYGRGDWADTWENKWDSTPAERARWRDEVTTGRWSQWTAVSFPSHLLIAEDHETKFGLLDPEPEIVHPEPGIGALLTEEQAAALPEGAWIRDCDGDEYTRNSHNDRWTRYKGGDRAQCRSGDWDLDMVFVFEPVTLADLPEAAKPDPAELPLDEPLYVARVLEQHDGFKVTHYEVVDQNMLVFQREREFSNLSAALDYAENLRPMIDQIATTRELTTEQAQHLKQLVQTY